MHLHLKDWSAALRIATSHDAAASADILCHRGDDAATAGNFAEAEEAYVSAKAPEKAIKMYKGAQMWDDALRLAHMWRPDATREIERQRAAAATAARGAAGASVDAKLQKAKVFERQVHANKHAGSAAIALHAV